MPSTQPAEMPFDIQAWEPEPARRQESGLRSFGELFSLGQ